MPTSKPARPPLADDLRSRKQRERARARSTTPTLENRCRRKRRAISDHAARSPGRKSSSSSADERTSRTGTSASARTLTARATSASVAVGKAQRRVGAVLRGDAGGREHGPRRLEPIRRDADDRAAPRGRLSAERLGPGQPAPFDEHDAVADALDLGELVRVQDDRRAAGAGGQDLFADDRDAQGIGARRRLVEEEEVGLAERRLGDADALQHSARVRPQLLAEDGRIEADPVGRGREPRRSVSRRDRPRRGASETRGSSRPSGRGRTRGARACIRCARAPTGRRRRGRPRASGPNPAAGSRAGTRAASSCRPRWGR